MSLSGLKDIDREILKYVDDGELLKICSVDKKMWNEVCDDNFLKRRLSQYPGIEKYKGQKSWKKLSSNPRKPTSPCGWSPWSGFPIGGVPTARAIRPGNKRCVMIQRKKAALRATAGLPSSEMIADCDSHCWTSQQWHQT